MAHQKFSAQHFHHQPVYPRFQRSVQVKRIGLTDALPVRKDMGRTKVEVEKKNEKQRYYSVKIMQESSCLTERRKLIREHSMTEKQ